MSHLDQRLIDAAIRQLEQRFPGRDGVAAAILLENGGELTGVSFDPEWGGGALCAETGPILEAHRRGARILASACVGRLSADEPVVILAPCGICQERLFSWGDDVEVAVADPDDPRRWRVFSLGDVQPARWVRAYGARAAAGDAPPFRG